MKQREAEKLKALRKMLEEQREHMDEIEKHITKLEHETEGKK
jgi:Mitochondrial ATPase inhibitor, IATP